MPTTLVHGSPIRGDTGARIRRQTGTYVDTSTNDPPPTTHPDGPGVPRSPGVSGKTGVPRWPATVALLIVGALFLFVSDGLTIGPSWGPLAIVTIVLIPLTLASLRGRHGLRRQLTFAVLALLTAAVVVSTFYLFQQLLRGRLPAEALLQGAGAVWAANVVVFALWYWEIDGGGPAQRRSDAHVSSDFLFPQLQVAGGRLSEGWAPGFLDYTFLAFNTSTAFSPTDTLTLSRRAKVLMMIQTVVSLLTIVVLAARAINTLR